MAQPRILLVADAVGFTTTTLQQALTPGWQWLRSAFPKELQPRARWAIVGLGLRVAGAAACDVCDCAPVRRWRGVVPAIFEVVEPRKLVKLSGFPFLSHHFGKLLTFGG